MKTQLSVIVKKESLYSRMIGKWTWGPLSFFGSRPMELYLDGKVYSMNPSGKAYEYDLAPGTHMIRFHDPKQDQKRAFSKFNASFQGAVWGFAAAGATGGSTLLGAILGEKVGSSMRGAVHEDGTLEVTMQDGDVLKLECRSNSKGVVKVKAI